MSKNKVLNKVSVKPLFVPLLRTYFFSTTSRITTLICALVNMHKIQEGHGKGKSIPFSNINILSFEKLRKQKA